MFSNGAEHREFLRRNCLCCPMYVDFFESDGKKQRLVCPIENRLSWASFTGDPDDFPGEWIDGLTCRKRIGKGPKPKERTKRPKRVYICSECGKRFELPGKGGKRLTRSGEWRPLCGECIARPIWPVDEAAD